MVEITTYREGDTERCPQHGATEKWLTRRMCFNGHLWWVPDSPERTPQTAFISGHLDVTEAEFFEHYMPSIDKAIEIGDNFVIGDAKGADSFANNMLLRCFAASPQRVTVFHMLHSPRYTTAFPLRGGYRSDEERDEAMTIASDYDIAWVRPGREKSGTAKNLERRLHARNSGYECVALVKNKSLVELKHIRTALQMEIAYRERNKLK